MQLGYSQLFKTASGNSYEPETVAYLAAETTAGKSYTPPQQVLIDRWFKDIKGVANGSYSTANVISRIKWCYLYLAGTGAPDRVNAVNPGTYNGVDTGSPTYSSAAGNLYVSFNGTSQYTDTVFVPNGSVSIGTSDFTGFGYHRRDTNSDSNATIGEVGGGNSYMVLQSGFKTIVEGAQNAYNASNASAINGLWFTSWSGSSLQNTYYNGANIAAVANSFGNTPTRSILIGAFNNSSPGFGGPITVDFAIAVSGTWTDAEALLIYNATKALKAGFGVTWI